MSSCQKDFAALGIVGAPYSKAFNECLEVMVNRYKLNVFLLAVGALILQLLGAVQTEYHVAAVLALSRLAICGDN